MRAPHVCGHDAEPKPEGSFPCIVSRGRLPIKAAGQDVDAAGPELAAARRVNHEQGERARVPVVWKVAQVVRQFRDHRALACFPYFRFRARARPSHAQGL
jgi:hypothetical protein